MFELGGNSFFVMIMNLSIVILFGTLDWEMTLAYKRLEGCFAYRLKLSIRP